MVAVLGLRITGGCPSKTVHPRQSFQNARAEKGVMAKQCKGPGMAPHCHIKGQGFQATLLLDPCIKKDLSALKNCLGLYLFSGRFKVGEK